jgi:hypothetical protein
MSKFRPFLLVTAVLLVSRVASADTGDWQDKWESNYNPGRAQRRSDFAVGLLAGYTVAAVSGYPNDVEKIDNPTYRASTGAGTGSGMGFWVGAALRDWIVVGIGALASTVNGNGYESTGGAFVLHVEGFPLFYEGPVFRDLGIVGDFGAGGRTITKDSNVVADGGAMSFVALGLIYEPFRIPSHISAGPILQVAEQFSQTLTSTTVTAGFQVAFYGGPG